MKNSRFSKIHAYQGLVFGGAGLGFFLLLCVFISIMGMAVGGFIALALQCLWIVAFLPWLVGLYFAYLVYAKEQVVLPMLTDATRAVFKDL